MLVQQAHLQTEPSPQYLSQTLIIKTHTGIRSSGKMALSNEQILFLVMSISVLVNLPISWLIEFNYNTIEDVYRYTVCNIQCPICSRSFRKYLRINDRGGFFMIIQVSQLSFHQSTTGTRHRNTSYKGNSSAVA